MAKEKKDIQVQIDKAKVVAYDLQARIFKDKAALGEKVKLLQDKFNEIEQLEIKLKG